MNTVLDKFLHHATRHFTGRIGSRLAGGGGGVPSLHQSESDPEKGIADVTRNEGAFGAEIKLAPMDAPSPGLLCEFHTSCMSLILSPARRAQDPAHNPAQDPT